MEGELVVQMHAIQKELERIAVVLERLLAREEGCVVTGLVSTKEKTGEKRWEERA